MLLAVSQGGVFRVWDVRCGGGETDVQVGECEVRRGGECEMLKVGGVARLRVV